MDKYLSQKIKGGNQEEEGEEVKEYLQQKEKKDVIQNENLKKEKFKEKQLNQDLKKQNTQESDNQTLVLSSPEHNSEEEKKSDNPEREKSQIIKTINSKEESYTNEKNFNVKFYTGESPTTMTNITLQKMHSWFQIYTLVLKKDFDFLEKNHSYIQWLFPNYYGSRFNWDSFPLTKKEAEEFRKTKKIAENLIKSYEMMLEFYGIDLIDKKTGELKRSQIYKDRFICNNLTNCRYYKTFITSFHNHLRIERILASLSVTGFRKYAIRFEEFLRNEIYINKDEYNLSPPLSYQSIKNSYQNQWKLYKHYETNQEKTLFFQRCLIIDETELTDSIFFCAK